MFDQTEIQFILGRVRKAIDTYGMIEDGDRIAVGISGGKDSLTLLCALALLRRFYPKRYDLVAITVDMGFEGVKFTPIATLCEELNVEYHVVPSDIAKIIFEIRKEENPCSLCSKMRRGALHDEAVRLGCNKVALGHHFNDVVETTMLNLFFEGRFGCFQPVTFLSRTGITLIRPLIETEEKDVRSFAHRVGLPVMESPCPADGNTERAAMKDYLAEFDAKHPGLYRRIEGALKRSGIDGYREAIRKGDL